MDILGITNHDTAKRTVETLCRMAERYSVTEPKWYACGWIFTSEGDQTVGVSRLVPLRLKRLQIVRYV